MIRKTKHGDYEKGFIVHPFARYQVHVIFTKDLQKSWQARNSGRVDIGDDCRAFHHTFDSGYSSLYFLLGDCPTGTVAHECLHAVWALLEYVGIGFKEEEAVTYLLDYIVQAVQDFKNQMIDQGIGVKSRKKKRRL